MLARKQSIVESLETRRLLSGGPSGRGVLLILATTSKQRHPHPLSKR